MIAWLVETLVAVTCLMLVVLMLRGPVARSFGAGWAYALWAVPALRLLLPPLPHWAPELAIPSAAIFIPATAELTAPPTALAGSGQWVPFILAMWAGGAVIFLVVQWLAYRTFLGALDQTSRPARPPAFGGIRTWISSAVSGPLALGLVERRIILPTDFMRRYGPGERRLALQHELVHHRRGDLWWNLAAMTVLALFWFNPIAWIAFRAFRSDQELACDAAVARGASAEERCDYARALVKSASGPGLIAASALNPAGQLKRRLKMIRAHRASPLRAAGGVVALSAFAFAGFAVGSGKVMPTVAAAAQAAATPLAAARPATAAGAGTRMASIVITAPPARAAHPRAVRTAPLAIASATETPRAPASLAQMLGHLPAVSLGGASPMPDRFAFHIPAGAQQVTERQVFRVSAQGGARQFFFVATRVTNLHGDDVDRAVAAAVAEAAAQGKIRAKARADAAPDGSDEGKFEINIQTIERGE